MKALIITAFLCFGQSQALAAQGKPQSVAPTSTANSTSTNKMPKKSSISQTKEHMNQFLEEMIALREFFTSTPKFTDEANDKKISSHLKKMSTTAKKAAHDPILNQENFKFSWHVLENHIAETERVYHSGNKSYARWMMSSTISVCMTCHTQIPAASRSLKKFEEFSSFATPSDKADFYFATRVFDKAADIYDSIIQNYPKNKATAEQVENALERQVTYYSRIKRDSGAALEKLKIYSENKAIPTFLRNNIAAWIPQFEGLKKQTPIDPKSIGEKEMLNYAKERLNSKKQDEMVEANSPWLITYLHVSGLLYEFLNHHPNTEKTPEILYLLSICERSISQDFFYSLADLYLRECITRYPSQPVAKQCYSEYEKAILFGYTGSSGTHLPAGVKEDLKSLKKHVDSGGKVQIFDN